MARYLGSEALRLDNAERSRELELESTSFDVVEGGGLDAQVRRGVSADFLMSARLFAVVFLALALIGAGRVALTTATSRLLLANLELQEGIVEARDMNSSLRIERSVLCSGSRIDRIAQQNFGMVPAVNRDSLAVGEAAVVKQTELQTTSPVATPEVLLSGGAMADNLGDGEDEKPQTALQQAPTLRKVGDASAPRQ